jgi:hypothetical protein
MPMGMRPQGTRALLTGKTVTTAGVEVLVAVAVAVVVKRLVTVVELRVIVTVLAEWYVLGGSVLFCVTV